MADRPAERTRQDIGANIAVARKAARFTQTELADRAFVSYSLLTKVESGAKPATPAFVGAVARALNVSTTRLHGQPYDPQATMRDQGLHGAVEPLRRVLYSFDVEPDQTSPVRPLPVLREEVARVVRLYENFRLSSLGALAPALIEELAATAHQATGREREEAFGLLAAALRAARTIPYRLGHSDTMSLADRGFAWAAERSGDELMAHGVTDWLRVDALLDTGDYRAGLRLVEGRLRQVDDVARHDDVAGLSVYGSLHLRGAILAARAGMTELARDHAAEAQQTAARLRTEGNVYQLMFSKANAAIHAVAVEVELGNSAEAVELGKDLRLPADLPRARSSHHAIDMARAWLCHGDRRRSLSALLQAERLAPQQVRYHPMALETARMLMHQERRAPDTLLGLATRLGVT